jgi:hypothetical protein
MVTQRSEAKECSLQEYVTANCAKRNLLGFILTSKGHDKI